MAFVSVIIPNYNHAQYLDERIQSILNQTWQDFEIIILDDCSTDNSIEVIEKYRNHPKVSHIVYNQNNSGSTFIQWNKGFELAKGEYIWIAESDDTCEPTLLGHLLRGFENNNIVLSFCSSVIINSQGNKSDILQRNLCTAIMDGKEFIKKYLIFGNIIYNASSALFKKTVISQINTSYISYKASGDWLFWILLCECGDVSIINLPLNYFRKHNTNVTNKLESNGIQEIENWNIYNKLYNKRYISLLNNIRIRISHAYGILYVKKITDDEIKTDLLRKWHISLFMKCLCFIKKVKSSICI